MQVDRKRACASCGSENSSDADFCWRCLVPFPTLPPPPGAVPRGPGSGRPAAPPRWAPSTDARTPTAESSRLVVAIVSIAAALAGYVGVQYLLGPGFSLPGSLAGADRLSDRESQRFEDYLREQGERYGMDVEGGVYGGALGPEFFVILVEGAAVETTDQLFDALLLGFSQAGAVVDRSSATSGTRDGSDYRCAGANAASETAVACMWRDDDAVGIVLEMPGSLQGTRGLLWTVHDSVVG
jgi:hypothetical protein